MTTSDGVRAALSWLATYGLHSTLFLGGTWLLCALRPPKVNRNRERMWKLALIGGLLSATLQPALGSAPLLGRIDWRPVDVRDPRDVRGPNMPGPNVLDDAVASRPSDPSTVRDALEREWSKPEDASSPNGEPHAASHPPRLEPPLREPARRGAAAPAASVGAGTSVKPPTTPREDACEAEEQPVVAGKEMRASTTGATSPASAVDRLDGAREGLPFLPQAWSRRWPGLVLFAWTAVGLLGVAGLLASWTCLRWRMLERQVLRDGPLVEILERLRERARVRSRVRLSVSPRISTPFSTGLLRPEVCVPTGVLTELSRPQQEALLAHELAHLVRRDPAWFGLSFLIEKLFFFQPLNRLARRQLAELAEVACDDWAVRWTGARIALASCLAHVAGWVIGERPRLLAQPGLAGHRSRLGRRVERLLDDRRSPAGEPPAPWWPPLAAGVLALAALAVPGVSASAGPSIAGNAERSLSSNEKSNEKEHAPPAPARLASGTHESKGALETVVRESRIPTALTVERGVLESELALLEVELAALHAELEARALRTRFADVLARIDERMEELRTQHRQVRELLARLAQNTPARGPAPSAEVPSPTADSPDSPPDSQIANPRGPR